MFLQQLIDVFTLEGESAAGTDLTGKAICYYKIIRIYYPHSYWSTAVFR